MENGFIFFSKEMNPENEYGGQVGTCIPLTHTIHV